MTSTLEVGERIIALLDEGLFTATYKYAVLIGLLASAWSGAPKRERDRLR